MGYKVLVVDGNKDNRELVRKILVSSDENYKILTAANGKEGYEAAVKNLPDLIVLDSGTTQNEGLKTLELINSEEATKDIPVVFITPIDKPKNLENAYKHGAADCVNKPPKEFELLLRIRKILDFKESMKSAKELLDQYQEEKEELEKRALIPHSMQNSFILINTNGELEWANDGFRNLHGYKLEEFKERFGSTIFSLCDQTDILNLFTKCIKEKEPINYVNKIKTRTGEDRWLQTYIQPRLNHNNNIDKLIAIETDITLMKKKEEELNLQNKRMTLIKENLEKANSLLEEQKKEINIQKQLIEEEQNKSEDLLLNILPFEIARQLKSKGKAGTRHYNMVSVVFADFKGFSKISKELEPKDLVNILDTYFAKFDEIIEKHYLEKIKTIGDAYMFAGGLPLRNKSNPFDAVIAALEIQHYMNLLNDSKVLDNLSVWELRLGIHTGPVVAGVVGKKKFAYDIWGDTVNIASRMEQAGHAGMVNISGSTYKYIKDFFECDYRGKIEAKNIGKVDMYFVNRIKADYSEDKLGYIPNKGFINTINKL
ncbi:MAG: response regulator [Bacteroidales bacterium]|nr:MAG: response regulator [Bacteroidales bacterium]